MTGRTSIVQITTLRIENVRNLRDVELTAEPGMNWLYGPNGAGKTSVLEAIHVLARGRSFRVNTLSAVIRDGSDRFRVFLRTAGPDHRLGVERQPGEWTGRKDGESCNRMSEFARALPVVLVDPENHLLVEGGPSLRRSFLDWGLFHVEHAYLDEWKRYGRLLRQRNAALRARAEGALLDSLERPMAAAAARVDSLRNGYAAGLQHRLAEVQQELGFHLPDLSIRYRAVCASAEEYADRWRTHRQRDLEQGFTREGPHRADLSVRAADRAAAPRLSRGQMKLAALMLKLAQMRTAGHGETSPVLLLDDPVSELDAEHLGALLGWLEAQPNQAWLTAVDAPSRPAAAMFHVEQGEIRRVV